MQLSDQPFVSPIKKLVRIAFMLSGCLALIAAIAIYCYRNDDNAWTIDDFKSIFLWYSMLFVMWSNFISLPALVATIMYELYIWEFNWPKIKTEIKLLGFMLAAIGLLFITVLRYGRM